MGAAMIVPDPQTDAAFLHGTFKPNRPTVAVFKDPFCPYCIRAIPRLGELSYYNVYVFWSPILGPRSEARVEEILRCPSVASADVLAAVVERQPPDCTDPTRPEVVARNKAVVESYQINVVPSFFMGGQRTSLAALARASSAMTLAVNGVTIDWTRYPLMEHVGLAEAQARALIVLDRAEGRLETAVEALSPQFVFAAGDAGRAWIDARCRMADGACGDDYRERYARGVQELVMLLGLEEAMAPAYLVGNDGTLSPYGADVQL